MNFITFPVASTNIFPLANSVAGGQLVTEYNLRCRDFVTSDPSIEYNCGNSYTHSDDDFLVRQQQDSTGVVISSTKLEILPGLAIINGHFVETFSTMMVDILEANNELQNRSMAPLKGKLAIGIRAFYSTEPTMAGAMEAENDEEMYEGIQLVVLPEDEIVLPVDSPTDQDKVTCHLKLATFNFINGAISSVKNCTNKFQYIDAKRIYDIENLLSDTFIKKTGLDPKKLYVFAGKGTDPSTGKDTWCDATDSLIVWDKSPVRGTTKPSVESSFATETNGKVALVLAHKQVDGMTTTSGDNEYYQDKLLELPLANYGQNTSGTVDETYTKNIKKISEKFSNIHQIIKGKQVYYLESFTSDDTLPKINPAWNIGDYVLVGLDHTVDTQTDDFRSCSTLYAVIPGYVQDYQFYTKGAVDSDTIPSGLTGVELQEIITDSAPASTFAVESEQVLTALQNSPISTEETVTVTQGSTNTILTEDTLDYQTGEISESLSSTFTSKATASYSYLASSKNNIFADYADFRGTPYKDYFVVTYEYTTEEDDGTETSHFQKYYYVVSASSAREWSSPIFVTGEIGLATEQVVGGFYNVPDTATDAGYVIRNENGYLQLVDYSLLRSGVLAYQLGEDLTLPSGLSSSEVQDYLDEYVNQRVAFPNYNQSQNSETPNVIHVYVDLVAEDSETTINIYDIDSRFNTSVYLHFTGSADSNTTINIVDCQKVRIDNNIEGSPVINIYRSCVYYDAYVLQYVATCNRDTDEEDFSGMQDISFWYQVYEETDPDLIVDGMTIFELNAPIVSDDIDFWTPIATNDNHYCVALNSITFSRTGSIVKCGLLVANQSTDNIDTGHKIIVGDFTLPQGNGLLYPTACLTRQLKVTGTFVSAYNVGDKEWIVMNTSFTATTQTYDIYNDTQSASGMIAFHTDTNLVEADLGSTTEEGGIEAWATDTYHLFYGGAFT